MTFRTRFAPSPTGPLHLGHAFSALTAAQLAAENDGTFLLRIEDIDQSRARSEWEAQIYDDLAWLGLSWPEPVMRQSDRLEVYGDALRQLWESGVLFACTCTRRDIAEATSAPQEGGGALIGPDGVVYPGTCYDKGNLAGDAPFPTDTALRLRIAEAVARTAQNGMFWFEETGTGPEGQTGKITFTAESVIHDIGDVVLARRDMGTSYHLSVVLDDAAQGITHVVRGADLFEATKIHVVLQRLLGLPTPIYHHHRLIRDETGKRLAKRHDAEALSLYRKQGKSADNITSILEV